VRDTHGIADQCRGGGAVSKRLNSSGAGYIERPMYCPEYTPTCSAALFWGIQAAINLRLASRLHYEQE
jgi:hypothetical protein